MYLFVNDVSKVNCMHSVVNELKEKSYLVFQKKVALHCSLKKGNIRFKKEKEKKLLK